MLRRSRIPAGVLTAVVALLVVSAGASSGSILAPTPVDIPAVADAYVSSASPSTNFGTSVSLRDDASPDTRSYLRFDLTSITAPIVSAALVLTPTSSLKAGVEIHSVADDTWLENGSGGVTYANAPPFDTSVAATTGALVAGTPSSVDVTQLALAARGSHLDLALVPVSSTAVTFGSRESGTAPTLVVTVDPSLQPPGNTSLPTIADAQGNSPPIDGDTLSASPGTWSPTPTGFNYQWQQCTSDLSSCSDVGADAPSYVLADGDVGTVVRVVVTASNSVGAGVPAASQPTAVVAPVPVQQTYTLTPVADTYVESDLSGTSFGTSTKLRLDQSPDTRSYLRFDLSGVSGPIVAASLQVVPATSLSAGFEVHAVSDTSWTEAGTTYANAPAFSASVAGLSGPVKANTAVSTTVTPAIAGGGLVSLALVPRSSTALSLGSRESATPPKLVVQVDRSLQAPASTAAPAIRDSQGNDPPQPGDELLADPGTWSGSPSAFHFAWQECRPDLTGCSPAGIDAASYSLGPADVGLVLEVTVTAVNAAGSGSATSAPSHAVESQDLGHDPVIMAAGDIACSATSSGGSCQQMATANLLVAGTPDIVLPLGDDQYECGYLSDFLANYDPSWGREKAIERPAVGNHEYTTSTNSTNNCYGAAPGAPGYYTYFGSAASPLDANCQVSCRGYYSYDTGAWHMIVLNSNCTRGVSCAAGSLQAAWLQNDLAAHPNQCTLAYFHHPRWTSGQEGGSPDVQPLIDLLYAGHADVILNGHDHDYERFAPLAADGTVDPANGIREFVVGTGGRNTTSFVQTTPGSELRDSGSFGVLRMVLHPTGYEWQFVPAAGSTLTDAGSQPCHIAAADDTAAPSQPAGPAAVAVQSTRVDVSWDAAVDNVGVVAYRVFRDGSLLTTIGNLRGYSDTTVAPSTAYSYTVSALDASGNESPQSDPVSVVTPPAEATPPLFADGFESGTMSRWTSLVAASATSDASADGRFSAHLVALNAPSFAYEQLQAGTGEIWLSARLRIDSLGTMANLLRLRTASGSGVVTAFVNGNGILEVHNEVGGGTLASNLDIADGTWHTILLHVLLGSSGLIETTLDGTPVPALSGAQPLGTTPIARVQIGDTQTLHQFGAYLDDVLATSTAR